MTARGSGLGGELILASGSPRRRKLLAENGIEFRPVTPGAVEVPIYRDEDVRQYVEKTAMSKAGCVARRHYQQRVLAADTIVTIDGRVLGKPAIRARAIRMLKTLSGRTHSVITAVAIAICAGDGRLWMESAMETTCVTFRPLAEREIENYVTSGEAVDKAGGYGIQGPGRRLIAGYDGSYTNVVGLPMELVREMLQEFSGISAAQGCADQSGRGRL